MGDEAEANWEAMLTNHLPGRYKVVPKCKFVDCEGNLSDEIDLALVDRQYSTLILQAQSRAIVPAEAAYAVFEAKPRASRAHLLYAAAKAASVRGLARTSAPIVDARGRIDPPRPPSPIMAGLLTVGSDWVDGLGAAFRRALSDQDPVGQIDLGCVLLHGGWEVNYEVDPIGISVSVGEQSLVSFYLRLLARLQDVGTVPAMDFGAWSAFVRRRPQP
jgi:hypothetical protein